MLQCLFEMENESKNGNTLSRCVYLIQRIGEEEEKTNYQSMLESTCDCTDYKLQETPLCNYNTKLQHCLLCHTRILESLINLVIVPLFICI